MYGRRTCLAGYLCLMLFDFLRVIRIHLGDCTDITREESPSQCPFWVLPGSFGRSDVKIARKCQIENVPGCKAACKQEYATRCGHYLRSRRPLLGPKLSRISRNGRGTLWSSRGFSVEHQASRRLLHICNHRPQIAPKEQGDASAKKRWEDS